MPYRGDRYEYTIPELRAIEEMYLEGLDVIHYEDRRGREYIISEWRSVAEYRADFQRGCAYIGRIAGRGRMSYKECECIVGFLNGKVS